MPGGEICKKIDKCKCIGVRKRHTSILHVEIVKRGLQEVGIIGIPTADRKTSSCCGRVRCACGFARAEGGSHEGKSLTPHCNLFNDQEDRMQAWMLRFYSKTPTKSRRQHAQHDAQISFIRFKFIWFQQI